MNSYTRLLLILLLIATGPLWKPLVISSELSYQSIPARMGRFDYQADVMSQQGEYDFVFMGASGMWTGINHDVLEAKWKELYSEEIRSVTFAHNWLGEELKYLHMVDFIKNNHAKWYVVDLPAHNVTPHPASKYVWNIWQDDGFFWTLPVSEKIKIYAEQVLIVPRLLYSKVFGAKKLLNDSYVSRNKGALVQELGYSSGRGVKHLPFDETASTSGNVLDPEDFVFTSSLEVGSSYVQRGKPFTAMSSRYMQRIEQLAQSQGSGVIYLHIPKHNREVDKILARYPIFSSRSNTIAVPVGTIFDGLTNDEVTKYFKNYSHLNKNGAMYFTNTIVPLLRRVTSEEYVDQG